ncbi:PE family protein [Mycobacterium shinjukuense]|uniref:PE family protein n=1 Tax=Mycobacterium shinjukuense TaxID=398694 RepID=A0A7I7MMQ5_9MYCO|nr:PE family protein [Mycobacterium shinjukuense]MCV6984631.1 PE family protein [Mycobacterium shinjukuense]ORB63568.1 PE family protein [Mycobacterium shinjukuense]BBX73485.1 PE family protein [Mycobacterium shinjukuense]
MSLVTTQPAALATAPGQLPRVGAATAAQNAAAPATTGLAAAATDDVSVLTATQFGTQGARYQTVGAQAMAIHEPFVAILGAGAGSYAATEAANAVS